MILKRLVTRNYRQHEYLDIPIEGTLIAVVGPNGSGKSNWLGAIQYAFTGEQTGFKKSDLLRWGTTEGDVTVHFEHNGVQAVLTRALHNSSALLTYGDETFRGASNVTEALRLHLELDKDLSKLAVFVRQAEIDAILFTDPRIRELSFQKLMGIGDATKIHKLLGDILGEMGDLPNYDEQIAEGQKRWSELMERFKGVQETVEGTKRQRETVPAMETINATLANRMTLVNKLTRAGEILQQIAQANKQAEEAGQQLDKLPKVTGSLGEIDNQLDAYRKRLKVAEDIERASADRERASKALLDLGASPFAPEELKKLKTDYDMYTSELNQLVGKHKLHADMLVALQKPGSESLKECPVCGHAITDVGALQARLTGILNQLSQACGNLQMAQSTAQTWWVGAEQRTTAYQREFAVRKSALDHANQVYESLQEPLESVTELRKLVTDTEQRRKVLVDTVMQRSRLEGQYTANKKAAEAATQEHVDTVCALANLGLDMSVIQPTAYAMTIAYFKDEISKYEAQREQLRALDTELARLEGSLNEMKNTMGTLDKTIATLEFKRSQQKQHRDVVTTLTNVRNWFHYANGPHVLSTSVLTTMTEDVNTFLSQFTAPFTVEPASDALGFRCNFTDGRDMPSDGPPDASMLSGGQKIQLAIAFRFAAYCMFAGKLGLLSLDEPTVYLDDANVGRFCDLLQQVKRVAQGMNLQVFIATHERSVMPFVDTVIDLANPDTISTNTGT